LQCLSSSDKEEPNPDEGDQEVKYGIYVESVIFTGETWSSEEFPNPMPVYKIIGIVTVDLCDMKPDKKEPKEKPLVLPQVDLRIQATENLVITI
jgi:hypothetical protein